MRLMNPTRRALLGTLSAAARAPARACSSAPGRRRSAPAVAAC